MEFDENDLENVSSTTSDMARKYVIKKLTDNNYRMWKMWMELILERTNLKEIVDRSSTMPARVGDVQRNLKSKDLDARMEIIMHLSGEQVDHVSSLKTAYKMWDHLRKLHQPSMERRRYFHIGP